MGRSQGTAVPRAESQSLRGDDPHYAVNLIETICGLAGQLDYLERVQTSAVKEGLVEAVRSHDTAALYEWLVDAASLQGISDSVARGYIAEHGGVRWSNMQASLLGRPPCPKLKTYWQFHGCQYHKGSRSCAQIQHIEGCPLPNLPLRNGGLNQLAFSLFLFIRDVANGDLVGWIDDRLATAARTQRSDQPTRMGDSLIVPLRNIYGVSDKVLNMVLANLLLGAGQGKRHWVETGGSLLAVDSLVHNFLARTGILTRQGADHAYGPLCYGPGGCSAVLRQLSASINARRFNVGFPANFPRFVQSAVWRYCAQDEFAICNGNTIRDAARCQNGDCRIFGFCDRKALKN